MSLRIKALERKAFSRNSEGCWIPCICFRGSKVQQYVTPHRAEELAYTHRKTKKCSYNMRKTRSISTCLLKTSAVAKLTLLHAGNC